MLRLEAAIPEVTIPEAAIPKAAIYKRSHSAVLKAKKYLKKFYNLSIKMLKLSLNKLELISKSRGIKGYKSMSEDSLYQNQ